MSLLSNAKCAQIHAKLHVEAVEPNRHRDVDTGGREPVTVVLCHGFGGSARNFRPQARALGKEVRFVLYDMRGHARSEKPVPPEAYHFDCLVEDMASVVDAHATTKVIVGGLSLGAAVALGFTMRFPEKVDGVLLAAYPECSPSSQQWAENIAEELEKNGLEEAGKRFVWGPESRFDPKTRELVRLGFLEHAPWALAAISRLSLSPLGQVEDWASQLRLVRVPTRIVVGGDDAGSLGPSRSLATLIPGAVLSVIEGAGHVVNLARASEFDEELRELIAQVTDRKGPSLTR